MFTIISRSPRLGHRLQVANCLALDPFEMSGGTVQTEKVHSENLDLNLETFRKTQRKKIF